VSVDARDPDWRSDLRDAFRLERPVQTTPAGTRLRRLIAVTALAVVAVEAINFTTTEAPGYALFIRTFWALVRVIGFLVLMRAVRFGRVGARAFGLILSVTTVFAVARLVEPRSGSLLPRPLIVIGFLVLTALCVGIVWMLYRSEAVHEHLSGRQVRRHIPGWVLTARVCVLAYSALLMVPFLVALGAAFGGERRFDPSITVVILAAWFGLTLLVGVVIALVSFFVVVGHRWARWTVGVISLVVLVAQPVLCWLLLGVDGLLRDGTPLVVTALVALLALHRSRDQPTWIRPPQPREMPHREEQAKSV
jgi:hypothetical protein